MVQMKLLSMDESVQTASEKRMVPAIRNGCPTINYTEIRCCHFALFSALFHPLQMKNTIRSASAIRCALTINYWEANGYSVCFQVVLYTSVQLTGY